MALGSRSYPNCIASLSYSSPKAIVQPFSSPFVHARGVRRHGTLTVRRPSICPKMPLKRDHFCSARLMCNFNVIMHTRRRDRAGGSHYFPALSSSDGILVAAHHIVLSAGGCAAILARSLLRVEAVRRDNEIDIERARPVAAMKSVLDCGCVPYLRARAAGGRRALSTARRSPRLEQATARA